MPLDVARPILACLFASAFSLNSASATELKITSFSADGSTTVSNTFTQGIVTILGASAVTGPWAPLKNAFSLGSSTSLNIAPPAGKSFYRALAVDLTPSGSWLMTMNDITNLGMFVEVLLASEDQVSFYISDKLSPETIDLMYSYGTVPDTDVAAALVHDLNLILQGPSIYDSDRFQGVTLSPATQALLAQSPSDARLVQLNRMLLDDAYRAELVNKQDTAYPNLVQSFGLLTTVAGAGGDTFSPNNKWLPQFEGGPATNALLSRPHITMADRAGNLYIADKEAYAIRKVTLDGNIHTVAGNNNPGFGDTNPVPATSVSLNNPNGIWVFPDGKFYILDRDNGLIRKVETNGIMTLVADNGGPIVEGRGLWVSSDESILYYSAGTQVMRWDRTNGLAVFAPGFSQLGNLAVDNVGRLHVTDRLANYVYRLSADGETRTIVAGNGSSGGGGDDSPATETGLWQVRAIWFLPTGAYFLGTDNGSQIWYVDTSGYIHLFLNGNGIAYDGDGSWFYDPLTPKVSKIRQITCDYDGNLISTENDAGYIRKVQFLRFQP
jgi:hypothetical protein